MNTRLQELKAKQNEQRLSEINRLLDEAGVPTWVNLADSSVPSNVPQMRLKWFLSRRKNVSEWELDDPPRAMVSDHSPGINWAAHFDECKIPRQ